MRPKRWVRLFFRSSAQRAFASASFISPTFWPLGRVEVSFEAIMSVVAAGGERQNHDVLHLLGGRILALRATFEHADRLCDPRVIPAGLTNQPLDHSFVCHHLSFLALVRDRDKGSTAVDQLRLQLIDLLRQLSDHDTQLLLAVEGALVERIEGFAVVRI